MVTLMKLKLFAIVPSYCPIVSLALTINLGSFSPVSFHRISQLVTVRKGVSTLLMENSFFFYIYGTFTTISYRKRGICMGSGNTANTAHWNQFAVNCMILDFVILSN